MADPPPPADDWIPEAEAAAAAEPDPLRWSPRRLELLPAPGRPIRVAEVPMEQGFVGAGVWNAGIVLARLLARADLSGVRVLDVASGVGVVGLAAGAAGAHGVLSDYLLALVDALAANIAASGLQGRLEARVLDWYKLDAVPGDPLGRFQLICGSDPLTSSHELHPALADVAARFLDPAGGAVVIVTQGVADFAASAPALQGLEAAGLRVAQAPAPPELCGALAGLASSRTNGFTVTVAANGGGEEVLERLGLGGLGGMGEAGGAAGAAGAPAGGPGGVE